MDIFNQVRISDHNLDEFASPRWLKSKVDNMNRMMIRFSEHGGRVYIAERLEDDYSDEPFFEFSGRVIGPVTIDEHGIQFEATGRNGGKIQNIIITRQGVYGD